MTVIINNDIFYSFFSQRGSAGQSSAAATTSHSTTVTQTLKDTFQKQAASSQKANDLFAQFWYILLYLSEIFIPIPYIPDDNKKNTRVVINQNYKPHSHCPVPLFNPQSNVTEPNNSNVVTGSVISNLYEERHTAVVSICPPVCHPVCPPVCPTDSS